MDRRILAFISLFVFSQITWGREPLDPQEVAVIISEFQYQAQYKEIKNKKNGGWFDSCWIYQKVIETQYPGAAEPLKVNMTMYIPNRDDLKEEQIPAVIMVPPIGGVNYLDKKTAQTLCASDMAAVILSDDFANLDAQAKGSLRPADDHEETYRRITSAVKATMAMIDDDKNLDYQRIGIFGVSLGGILSSFVMATQPHISAGYFVVSGGDVPQILANSDQEEVASIRRKRMKEQNLSTVEEYEEFLREHMALDPVDLAMTMLPETLNMVISHSDNHVPSDNQYLLHEVFGSPDAEYSSEGHVLTVLSALFPATGRRRVARFFEERFELQNPRPSLFNNLLPEIPLAAM